MKSFSDWLFSLNNSFSFHWAVVTFNCTVLPHPLCFFRWIGEKVFLWMAEEYLHGALFWAVCHGHVFCRSQEHIGLSLPDRRGTNKKVDPQTWETQSDWWQRWQGYIDSEHTLHSEAPPSWLYMMRVCLPSSFRTGMFLNSFPHVHIKMNSSTAGKH